MRRAISADLPRIAAIYDEQVRTAVSTFDLEPAALSYWEARLASTEPGDHLLVAGLPDRRWPATPTRRRTARARRTGTPARCRSTSMRRRAGRGWVGALYDDLLARLRADGVHQVLAVVALPNDASEALHRACGFTRVGLLPEVGWKFDRWIDTALWGRTL